MSACSEQWNEAVSAWLDGECEAAERQRVEAHLRACAACARVAQDYGQLRAHLRATTPAADALPERLRASVEQLAQPQPAFRPRWHTRAVRRVAAAAAALLLVLGVLWTGWPRGFNEALAADLERHHLRAFSRATPCEFESSDPEAVRAWARKQAGYAVDVPQVPGATLLGARRCRLNGRVTVSLLYRYGNHALTLFAPPRDSSAGQAGQAFAEKGPRCTQGPVGERICVAARGEEVTFAVSELGDAVLLGVLGASGRP